MPPGGGLELCRVEGGLEGLAEIVKVSKKGSIELFIGTP